AGCVRYGCVGRGGLGVVDDDVRALGGRRLWVVCDLEAGARQGPAAGPIDVVALHAPAGANEVARERPSHDAEPDDTDLSFRHDQPPWHSSRGRYTAPSTAFKRDVAIGCAEGYLAHG